ncbi:response regulator transcription factor [Nonomuraea sp. NPDC050691]|uniref:response regulator transcription factor n=1 Tax=Nonomuraea sp. NPDC050691 TaxID=3155661 RepID=UPI0033F14D1C
MTIRVLVADDQEAAREALRLILDGEPDIDVIATAADGAEAVHQALLRRPDVVVMDLRMPGMDGIAAIGRLATPELDLLTPREHHVLRLLARGLSNGEIAAACTIEEGTVKTHVNRILTKLGLRTCVHAAIYAYEHGIVSRDAP